VFDSLETDPNFEVGIHPNFLPGSTHGSSPEQVIQYLKSIFPNAKSSRSHGLAQSGQILDALINEGIEVDASLFLPGVFPLRPFIFSLGQKQLTRLPYSWSDDYMAYQSEQNWEVDRLLDQPGSLTLNFHPLITYLNIRSIEDYVNLKQRYPRIKDLGPSELSEFQAGGKGPYSFFTNLLEATSKTGNSRLVIEAKGGARYGE
jgi:hypothetical protein